MDGGDGGGGSSWFPSLNAVGYNQWRNQFGARVHSHESKTTRRHNVQEMRPLGRHVEEGNNDGEAGEEDDADKANTARLLQLDEAEKLLRQQTLVMDQATASFDMLPMITYSIAVTVSSALTTTYLVQLTDQTLLIILGAVIVLVALYVIRRAILHFSLPKSTTTTDGEDNLAAATDSDRKRIYQAIGRLAHSLLFILMLLIMIVLLSIVVLAGILLYNVVGRSLPPMQLQPFSVMLGAWYFILFLEIVVFASQPAIGMIARPNAFLAIPSVNTWS